jgi:hypothetical protein
MARRTVRRLGPHLPFAHFTLGHDWYMIHWNDPEVRAEQAAAAAAAASARMSQSTPASSQTAPSSQPASQSTASSQLSSSSQVFPSSQTEQVLSSSQPASSQPQLTANTQGQGFTLQIDQATLEALMRSGLLNVNATPASQPSSQPTAPVSSQASQPFQVSSQPIQAFSQPLIRPAAPKVAPAPSSLEQQFTQKFGSWVWQACHAVLDKKAAEVEGASYGAEERLQVLPSALKQLYDYPPRVSMNSSYHADLLELKELLAMARTSLHFSSMS